MKIACLTVLLASATSASASPFSFLANGLTGGASAKCSDAQAAAGECFVMNNYAGTSDKCFGECLSKMARAVSCGEGCDIFNGCAQECVPECAGDLATAFNCLSEHHAKPGEEACTCAATKAPALPAMMRGFVPKPKLDIKDQLRAKEGPSVAEADREEEGSAKSRDIPTDVACVAIPTTRRGRRAFLGDRQCENFCSRESYDGHVFKDFFGSDTSESGTSLFTSLDCLCFEESKFTELSIASLTKTSEDLGVFPCSTLLTSTSTSAEEGAAVVEE